MKNTITVIEDSESSQPSLSKIISDLGYTVILVRDIIDFNRISNYKSSLIVIDDLQMQAAGNDVCKKLKEDARTAHIPILLISGRGNIKDLAGMCGAESFIKKPASRESLKEKIDLLLSVADARI